MAVGNPNNYEFSQTSRISLAFCTSPGSLLSIVSVNQAAIPCSLILSPGCFSEAEFSTMCSPISIGFASASFRQSDLDFSVPTITYLDVYAELLNLQHPSYVLGTFPDICHGLVCTNIFNIQLVSKFIYGVISTLEPFPSFPAF